MKERIDVRIVYFHTTYDDHDIISYNSEYKAKTSNGMTDKIQKQNYLH